MITQSDKFTVLAAVKLAHVQCPRANCEADEISECRVNTESGPPDWSIRYVEG